MVDERPAKFERDDRMWKLLAMVSTFLLGSSALRVGASMIPINLAAVANDQLALINTAYPTGMTTLGGITFDIPTSGNNIFSSNIAANQEAGTVTLTLPVNLSGVTSVDTLINTSWGQPGPGSLASLTFTFSDASTFSKSLVGDQDIRDHFSGVYTNTINGTTTVNVFATNQDGHAGPGEYRMDKQFIDLSSFANKTLSTITLTDNGNFEVQRTYLFGITVVTVPEPSSVMLLAIGVAGLCAYLYWSRNCTAWGQSHKQRRGPEWRREFSNESRIG